MIANTHRALRALVVLLLFTIFACGVAQAGPRYTAEFEKGKTQIVTIALLPPEASMTTLKVGQDDAMVAETAQIEDIASAITRVRFEQAGYALRTQGSSQCRDVEGRKAGLYARARSPRDLPARGRRG